MDKKKLVDDIFNFMFNDDIKTEKEANEDVNEIAKDLNNIGIKTKKTKLNKDGFTIELKDPYENDNIDKETKKEKTTKDWMNDKSPSSGLY